MAKSLVNANAKFGTAPVFFPADMLKNTEEFTEGYEQPGNILFVRANKVKAIN